MLSEAGIFNIKVNRVLAPNYECGEMTFKIRFLKIANFHRKTPFFKEVEILLCNQQEKVENLKKNLGERYRSTGEFENLVFVSSIELPSMRYNAEHTINKLIERVNFAECYKAKRKESLSLWNRLILIR